MLNSEICLYIIKMRTVLRHIILEKEIEVDKVKIYLIANLSLPTIMKYVRLFLRHDKFYRKFYTIQLDKTLKYN